VIAWNENKEQTRNRNQPIIILIERLAKEREERIQQEKRRQEEELKRKAKEEQRLQREKEQQTRTKAFESASANDSAAVLFLSFLPKTGI